MDKAMSLQNTTLPNPTLLDIDALNKQAWDLRRADAKQALSLSQDAFILAQAAAYPLGQAQSLLAQGRCYAQLAKLETALSKTQSALELFESLENNEGVRKALNTLGIIYGQSGNLREALKTFLTTQKLCAELGDEAGEADALNNIGIIYIHFGDYASALEAQLESLRLVQDPARYTNAGRVYYELGRYGDALEHFLSALAGNPDEHTRAVLLNQLARTHLVLGAHEQALEYAKESLEILENLGDRLEASYVLDDLGRIYLYVGNVDDASLCFHRSWATKKEVGDQKGEAETCIHLGHLYIRQGHIEGALDVLHEGLAKAQRAEAQAEVYKAHQALAEAHKLNRQFREACVHLEHYVNVKDAVYNQSSDLRLYGAKARFEVEQAVQEREIYRLKNVELANAIGRLDALTTSLERANEEKSLLLEQLRAQANCDGLTGLYNRRYLDAQLGREFERGQRSRVPLNVAVFDIDDFKRVNDAFSHQVGDEVLKRVARLLEAGARKVDTVARYGGEELVIVFPETALQEAARVCEHIRKEVEAYPWEEVAPGLRVTISVGLSHGLSEGHELLHRADAKLYEAKRNGKNQVRV